MALMKFREPNQVKWIGTRPGHDGTQVLARGAADSATTVLYTVPVGNTFYLCHSMMGYGAIAAGIAVFEIQDLVPVRVVDLFYDTLVAGIAGNSKNASYWPPIEIPAGYRIVVVSSAVGLTVHGTVFGWVE